MQSQSNVRWVFQLHHLLQVKGQQYRQARHGNAVNFVACSEQITGSETCGARKHANVDSTMLPAAQGSQPYPDRVSLSAFTG